MRSLLYTPALGFVAVSALALAGCAGSPGLTTASVSKPAAQPTIDPACAVLRTRITQLSGTDSTVTRLEKAADGKSKSVVVKRSALAAAAELNRLNTDYRARCSNPVLAKAVSKPPNVAANTATAAANQAISKATETAATQTAAKAAQAVAAAAKPKVN